MRFHVRGLLLVIAACASASGPSRAAERDLRDAKPQTAQVVTLVRSASVLCPETEVDEAAVQALMADAGISDRDVVDPGTFGSADLVVARSFARSFLTDPRDACSTVMSAFGSGERRLLRRLDKPT